MLEIMGSTEAGRRLEMRKWSLILAFASCGLASLLPLFYSIGLSQAIPYPDRLLCLPALLFGLASWMRTRSFSRYLPVLACLALFFAGVLVVDETEQGRGMLVFAGVVAAIPISALIVELKAARFCAKVFIYASIGNMLILLLASGGFAGEGRFGLLAIDDVRVSNPNGFAAQMGLAAVLIMALMQEQRNKAIAKIKSHLTQRAHLTQRDMQYYSMLAVCALGILMSASRGTILTLISVIMLRILSGNTRAIHRIVLCVSLFLVTLLVLSGENQIVSRFQDTEDIAALGNRLPLWQAGLEIMQSEAQYLWYGVGTGGAEKSLAEFLHRDYSFRMGEDGIYRRATHNSYVEWVLSHGLIGIPFGLWLIIAAIRTSVRLDRRDRSTDRRSLLAFCAIISMSTVLAASTTTVPLGTVTVFPSMVNVTVSVCVAVSITLYPTGCSVFRDCSSSS